MTFEEAWGRLDEVVRRVFASDPTVRSVGISRFGASYSFRAVRNRGALIPMRVPVHHVTQVADVPVLFVDGPGEVMPLLKVPHSGPASPWVQSVVPEVQRYRRLVSGLQVHNFDADDRNGTISAGYITIGTLGCFVRLPSGRVAALSNNHVAADENRGVRGHARILQPGSATPSDIDQIGLLADFVALKASPPGAMPADAGLEFNELDAAVVELDPLVQWTQGFLPFRNLVRPYILATPRLGDEVFKVGRTTGLTHGIIVDVNTVVGPIRYDTGPCWFRRTLTIEGVHGTTFSGCGDSGSIVVRGNGEVVGLLFAGNGQQTYACPIESVMNALACTLA